MSQHLTALATHGVHLDPTDLARVGWTLGTFDDAVTLRHLGYTDGQDCEWGWQGARCPGRTLSD